MALYPVSSRLRHAKQKELQNTAHELNDLYTTTGRRGELKQCVLITPITVTDVIQLDLKPSYYTQPSCLPRG